MRFPPKRDERFRRIVYAGKYGAGERGHVNFGTGV
jgi:hypothetical protein